MLGCMCIQKIVSESLGRELLLYFLSIMILILQSEIEYLETILSHYYIFTRRERQTRRICIHIL